MIKRCLSVAMLFLLLTGCSSKFAYNNLDWLVHWYVDDYIDFNDDQRNLFDQNFEGWMQWHRQEELANYRVHLVDLRQDIIEGELDADVVAMHVERGRRHWHRLRDRISPELVSLAQQVEDDQVAYMFAAFEKDNKEEEEEIEELLARGKSKALKRRVKSITGDFEDELGRLTKQQKAIIAKYAPEFIATGPDWLAYRRYYQNEARKLFVDRHNNPNFRHDLLTLMTNPDRYRSEDYIRLRNSNRQTTISMLSELAPTLTNKQRNKLLKRLDDIIDDIDDLRKS